MALSYTVTAHGAGAVREEIAAARAAGFRHVNFKIAVEPRSDAAVAAAVRDAAGPEAFVWADANQGLTLPGALAVVPGLAAAA